MPRTRLLLCCAFALLTVVSPFTSAQDSAKSSKFPFPEKLTYRVEWRLVTAGSATVNLSRAGSDSWQTNLDIQSAGLVTRLYKVLDTYRLTSNSRFCPSQSVLDAQEGKRHTITQLTFEVNRRIVRYDERDLVKNSNVQKVLDVPPCTHEVVGALAALRTTSIEPGKSAIFPVTDGKKVVNAKIEAQGREKVSVNGNTYQTIRYEAFLFDNVLYRRKGRLFVWISDDASRIPVQFKLQLGFPIGNVTVELEKQQTS
jgi:Protein of unknown function (DUF3108)